MPPRLSSFIDCLSTKHLGVQRQEPRGTQETWLGPFWDSQKGFVSKEGPEAAEGEHRTQAQISAAQWAGVSLQSMLREEHIG